MDEIKTNYSAYDHDRLETGRSVKIDHTIYVEGEKVDISALAALSLDRLQQLREESATAEKSVYENLKAQTALWEQQAGITAALDRALEYVQTPESKHTANKWQKTEYDHHVISNKVYQMKYYFYENTRYDREKKESIPYSYTLTWGVRTNGPDTHRQVKIAGQDRKVFADKASMEKYLRGRIKSYADLFTKLSPKIPPEYAKLFKVNGVLLPGYTIAGDEIKQPEQVLNSAPEKTETTTAPREKSAQADPQKSEMEAAPEAQEVTLTDEPRPVIPIVLTSEKPAEKLKEITDRLERGISELFDSERYEEYLRVMSRFHNYSFNNTLLIAMQKPDASLIAGFSAWKNDFQRSVMKGQKGIKILAPSPFKIKKEMEKIDPDTQRPFLGKDGKPVTEEKEITIPAFKVVSVFDVSQTEGKDIPAIGVNELTGDVKQYKDFFTALEKTSPVPIAFEKIKGGVHGYYHLEDKRIAIDGGMSQLQTLKTAIHEIAHARLHDVDLKAPKGEQSKIDRRTREVEAESVAYTVCQHYGLDTSDYSFGYVAGWSSGRQLAELKSSLETIRSAAGEIIRSIDESLAEIQKEQEQSAEQDAPSQKAAPDKDTFTIYQLKRTDETRSLRFETYGRLQAAGNSLDPKNYDLIYTAPLTAEMTLDTIFEQFNINHPKDFKGHSLSLSDVVVLHQDGQDTAHYVDSIGFQKVPEFLQEKQVPLIPDEHLTGEKIRTPRGSFSLTDMTAEQMKEAGYGFHHQSDNGKYLIMGNGTRAFAIAAEPSEKENPLKHVEDTVEQNDNNFDGIINNTPQTPTVSELEQKAKAGEPIALTELMDAIKADKELDSQKTTEKPSIRAQLKASREQQQKKPAKQKKQEMEV